TGVQTCALPISRTPGNASLRTVIGARLAPITVRRLAFPGVRVAARDGPRRRRAGATRRVVAAGVGERESADGDRGESRAWSPGAVVSNMGGTGGWRSVDVGGGRWR